MFAAIPWYLFVLVLTAVGVPLAFLWAQTLRHAHLLASAGLSHVQAMAVPEFLRYLEGVFAGLGYGVERPPARSDYGADLLLKDGTGRRTAVNARHFKERIGPEVLQEVAEGAEYHGCQDTLVVSVIGFANKTIAAAEETGTLLWDLDDLTTAMAKVRARPAHLRPSAGVAAPAQTAAAREPSPPAARPQTAPPPLAVTAGPPCPVCGRPMEPKIAAGQEIWLCSRFPHCNGASLRGGGASR